MCIFRTKSELEKLQSQLNEVKLQAEKYEALIKQLQEENKKLQEEIAEHKRINSLLSGDNEFIIREDNDEIVKVCEALEAQTVLLAKELLHLWAFREEHRERPLGGFSNIEWGGISSNVIRGLEAYTKEGKISEEEQLDINWMFDIFEAYEGNL